MWYGFILGALAMLFLQLATIGVASVVWIWKYRLREAQRQQETMDAVLRQVRDDNPMTPLEQIPPLLLFHRGRMH
jgi:hypothetical protein